MGTKGLVWSSAAMGVLLAEGIGDTIRVSLTPRPGGDRREEVYAACELLQSLGPAHLCAKRHRLPRLRPHHEFDVPGTGGSGAGLHPRADAVVEEDLRRRRVADARGDGLRRQRPRRIEGRQHRHLAARHGRSAATARCSSTACTRPRSRAPTTSWPSPSSSCSMTTSSASIRRSIVVEAGLETRRPMTHSPRATGRPRVRARHGRSAGVVRRAGLPVEGRTGRGRSPRARRSGLTACRTTVSPKRAARRRTSLVRRRARRPAGRLRLPGHPGRLLQRAAARAPVGARGHRRGRGQGRRFGPARPLARPGPANAAPTG